MTDDTKQDGAPEGQATSKAMLGMAALELYKPPFRFEHGYILDVDSRIMYDNEGMDTLGRVRGWGRIQYLPNPEALQDKVGEMIAEAITDYWKKHSV